MVVPITQGLPLQAFQFVSLHSCAKAAVPANAASVPAIARILKFISVSFGVEGS